MIVYVMRHAEAVEGSDVLADKWRYLTEKGRVTAQKMSTTVARYGPKTRLTITSPLTRAVQTAEIAAEKACRKNAVIASPLLLPGADINELVAYITACKHAKRLMLVGHEPQLGSLVAALLGYSDSRVSLKKSSCVALKLGVRDKPACFLWYLAPGKKRVTSVKKAFPQHPA
ncbi:MAG: phosphohistidine phosphatase SixA [Desulfuromonadaceae bacterium]|nr:phosphohistidine phosphatase SixA [Desulfuromonadaceae bacterium]